ncbi:MAG: Jag N-terminal domain-containing protein [Synergistales bacterium]|nr:Jag N-terminal domain-containing protein [Synergistales bacterium]
MPEYGYEDESVVVEASNEEEALAAALRQTGLAPGEMNIELLEEGRKFLGILGGKNTYQAVPVAEPHVRKAKTLLGEFLEHMGLIHVVPQYSEGRTLTLTGEDTEPLLQEYGEGLRSLEYLLNIMLRNREPGPWVRLECEGYRECRTAKLEQLAESAAERAVGRRRPASLEPMTSWERRVVHLALRERTDIETRSSGEGSERRVVVWPKKNNGPAGSRSRRRR